MVNTKLFIGSLLIISKLIIDMSIYLKQFETHAEYENYIRNHYAVSPNVSICNDEPDINHVHYNSVLPMYKVIFRYVAYPDGEILDPVIFYYPKGTRVSVPYDGPEIKGYRNGYADKSDFELMEDTTVTYTYDKIPKYENMSIKINQKTSSSVRSAGTFGRKPSIDVEGYYGFSNSTNNIFVNDNGEVYLNGTENLLDWNDVDFVKSLHRTYFKTGTWRLTDDSSTLVTLSETEPDIKTYEKID